MGVIPKCSLNLCIKWLREETPAAAAPNKSEQCNVRHTVHLLMHLWDVSVKIANSKRVDNPVKSLYRKNTSMRESTRKGT